MISNAFVLNKIKCSTQSGMCQSKKFPYSKDCNGNLLEIPTIVHQKIVIIGGKSVSNNS